MGPADQLALAKEGKVSADGIFGDLKLVHHFFGR